MRGRGRTKWRGWWIKWNELGARYFATGHKSSFRFFSNPWTSFTRDSYENLLLREWKWAKICKRADSEFVHSPSMQLTNESTYCLSIKESSYESETSMKIIVEGKSSSSNLGRQEREEKPFETIWLIYSPTCVSVRENAHYTFAWRLEFPLLVHKNYVLWMVSATGHKM